MTPKIPKNCNNRLKLLNNIKELQQKEREAWMDANGQDRNGLHLGNLEKSRPEVFQIASIKVVLAQNHLACDVMSILSVKEFHITMFEF